MAVTANYKVWKVVVTYPPYNKSTGAQSAGTTPATTQVTFQPNDAQIRNIDRIIVLFVGDQRASYLEGQQSAIVIPNSA